MQLLFSPKPFWYNADELSCPTQAGMLSAIGFAIPGHREDWFSSIGIIRCEIRFFLYSGTLQIFY